MGQFAFSCHIRTESGSDDLIQFLRKQDQTAPGGVEETP